MSPSRTRKIAAGLARLTHAYLQGGLQDAELVRQLRRFADQVDGIKVLQPKLPDLTRTVDEENSIFAHWQRRVEKPKAKFGSARREKIRARLREGFTEEQIKQAIDACSSSEFHMGDNERKQQYNDLTLICRSTEQLEKFLEMRGSQDPAAGDNPEIRRLQREAAEAMNRGDTDEYNATNARISACRAAG